MERVASQRAMQAALAAIDFLHRESWANGRLFAAWKAGSARFPAYLDDHAFLLEALLEALQSRFRAEDLAFARQVADALLERFADREHGGFRRALGYSPIGRFFRKMLVHHETPDE